MVTARPYIMQESHPPHSAKEPLLRRLYVQALIGIALGVLIGHYWPDVGADMKPLGEGFIKLIKMLLSPVIFGTASTESVLPQMMKKLEKAGCKKTVVGLVLPAGYAFNPDGTAIYLAIGAIFVAQATNIDLSLWQQLVILGVLMLTSEGSAGVARAGFVTLAATLGSMHTIPVSGLVLLLGVYRFLNEARAITNLIGNGLATIAVTKWEGAVTKWEGAFDQEKWIQTSSGVLPDVQEIEALDQLAAVSAVSYRGRAPHGSATVHVGA